MLSNSNFISMEFQVIFTQFDILTYFFRHEKRLWFMTLFMGTCMLYSTRTSMPLVLPAVSGEFRWSKTESGTVLSSFFWGYTITQVRFDFTWLPMGSMHQLHLVSTYSTLFSSFEKFFKIPCCRCWVDILVTELAVNVWYLYRRLAGR